MKREYCDCLTNEQLGKYCTNPFELIGRAIKLADHVVRSGKSFGGSNVAFAILSGIADEGAQFETSIHDS